MVGYAQKNIISSESLFSLKGRILPKAADTILVNKAFIYNGGGYMMSPTDAYPGTIFKIGYWNDRKNTYRIFIRSYLVESVRTDSITDILQIPQSELTGHTVIEQTCYANTWDEEIIAIIKDDKKQPEYFYNIKRAWRANRKTGLFEKLKKSKVKKCGNESYGI